MAKKKKTGRNASGKKWAGRPPIKPSGPVQTNSNPDRVDMFGDYKEVIWVWCLHCQRAYQSNEYRHDRSDDTYMCPYEDCDGNATLDQWTWKKVRDGHSNYPETPQRNTVYPLYPE